MENMEFFTQDDLDFFTNYNGDTSTEKDKMQVIWKKTEYWGKRISVEKVNVADLRFTSFYTTRWNKQVLHYIRTALGRGTPHSVFFNFGIIEDGLYAELNYDHRGTKSDLSLDQQEKLKEYREYPNKTHEIIQKEITDRDNWDTLVAKSIEYIKNHESTYQEMIEIVNPNLRKSRKAKENNNTNKTTNNDDYVKKTYNLNTILYGPPGTGKTSRTIKMAAEIITGSEIDTYEEAQRIFNNEIKKQEDSRIVFTTFHQNYSYEDFIQGIKPDIQEGSDTLKFRQNDGVFKKLADKARDNFEDSFKDTDQLSIEKRFDDALRKFIEEKEINEENPVKIEGTIVDVFDVLDEYFRVGSKWKNHGCIRFEDLKILATHKVEQREDADRIKKEMSTTMQVRINQYFCIYKEIQKYIGSSPQENEAIKVDLKNYVIIIDEINRANISRVFGELITLIEDDKRLGGTHTLTITLPSGEEFAVPNNLYIIGTMNTADKSIALLDIALRRRFEFKPMYPLRDIDKNQVVYKKEFLQTLNEKIKKDKGYDFQIGHSYFMGENFNFEKVINKKVIPLLLEYYRNDVEAVRNLINEALKETTEDFSIEENSFPLEISEITTNENQQ